jgi:hypothetical protein
MYTKSQNILAEYGKSITSYFSKLNAAGKVYSGAKQFGKNEKGTSAQETIISIAIVGIIAVGFTGGLGVASKTGLVVDQRETAKNLAEMQMEYVKSQSFANSYTGVVPSDYAGYTASITTGAVTSRDSNIQKITVVINNQNKPVMTLVDYKVK